MGTFVLECFRIFVLECFTLQQPDPVWERRSRKWRWSPTFCLLKICKGFGLEYSQIRIGAGSGYSQKNRGWLRIFSYKNWGWLRIFSKQILCWVRIFSNKNPNKGSTYQVSTFSLNILLKQCVLRLWLPEQEVCWFQELFLKFDQIQKSFDHRLSKRYLSCHLSNKTSTLLPRYKNWEKLG